MKSIKSLGLITLMCSQSALASSEWVSDQVYTAGDVVTWQGETYISSHWTNGIEPVINDISWDGWVYVENSDIQSWEPNKEYDGGDLVKINADYYIAKWWSKDSIPSDSSAWRKLSDFDVDPPTTPIAPVLGNDEDNNGIRDDYEEAVATMYLPSQQRYTQVAIAASFVWKMQTEVALDDTITMTPEAAAIAFNEELALDQCFLQLKAEDPDFEYPHLAYYNTVERAHRSRVGHERIGKMIGERTDLIIIPTEPCVGYNKGDTDEI
ncbi:hypothetical protein [Vibrio sp. FJH11]